MLNLTNATLPGINESLLELVRSPAARCNCICPGISQADLLVIFFEDGFVFLGCAAFLYFCYLKFIKGAK